MEYNTMQLIMSSRFMATKAAVTKVTVQSRAEDKTAPSHPFLKKNPVNVFFR